MKKSTKNFFRDYRLIFGGFFILILAIAALFAPYLAETPAGYSDIGMRLCKPSADRLLGCDLNGGSVETALLYGARISLYVSFVSVFLSTLIGTSIGLIAGYKGGLWDNLFMRVVDLLMAFPGILLAMSLAAFLGSSVNNIVLAITATGWTSSARLIRGQVLSIKEREFVLANLALGARPSRTILRHVLPSVWSTLAIQSTFSLSGVILVEASLSFLGLGPQESSPTWGALLSQGRTVLTEAPHLSIVPGLAIMLIVLSFNILGDTLRDYLDPKSRSPQSA